jgi:ribosomal protein L20A (L18A)
MSKEQAKPKRKMGYKMNAEKRKQALKLMAMGLTMKQVASFLEVGIKTIEENTTQEQRDAARAGINAQLLNSAYKQALDGSERMLIFLLKTRLRMAEGKADMKAKFEYEKELLDYKKQIGYTEYTSAPIEIHLSAPPTHTRDYDRNTIEADSSGASNTLLGINAPDGLDS